MEDVFEKGTWRPLRQTDSLTPIVKKRYNKFSPKTHGKT